MPFRKNVINPLTGKQETGTELDIVKSNQSVIELELEDGTLMRIKQSIIGVVRLDNKNEKGEDVYDIDGNIKIDIIPAEE